MMRNLVMLLKKMWLCCGDVGDVACDDEGDVACDDEGDVVGGDVGVVVWEEVGVVAIDVVGESYCGRCIMARNPPILTNNHILSRINSRQTWPLFAFIWCVGEE